MSDAKDSLDTSHGVSRQYWTVDDGTRMRCVHIVRDYAVEKLAVDDADPDAL